MNLSASLHPGRVIIHGIKQPCWGGFRHTFNAISQIYQNKPHRKNAPPQRQSAVISHQSPVGSRQYPAFNPQSVNNKDIATIAKVFAPLAVKTDPERPAFAPVRCARPSG